MNPTTPGMDTGGASIVGSGVGEGPGPEVMAASSLEDTKVYSSDGEHVGEIKEIMLDVPRGSVAYAVLATGGFLGIGDTLHAIPWNALVMDTDEKCFRLSITAERIQAAPGFDKDNWPRMADTQWGTQLHEYYEREPYWVGRSARADTMGSGAGGTGAIGGGIGGTGSPL